MTVTKRLSLNDGYGLKPTPYLPIFMVSKGFFVRHYYLPFACIDYGINNDSADKKLQN